MRRIGVFGGRFDPVHNGHLSAVRLAAEAIKLAEVWFMPTFVGKTSEGASGDHRIAMLRLVVAHEPRWVICDLETITRGAVPTVSLIKILRSALKRYEVLCWICGADSLLQMKERWLGGHEALDLCQFIAVERAGFDCSALPDEVKRKVILLPRGSPESYISGSVIRERARYGLNLAGFVPEAIAWYVKQHNLYRAKGDME